MDFLSKIALITGIDSFTGRHLKKRLEKEGILVCGTSQSESESPDIFQLDLTDQAAIHEILESVKPDYIIHLAAISFVGHDDKSEFYRVNVVGTENLLQAIIDVGLCPEKIILASSANVYGNTELKTISEKTAPEPVNHYACSKMAMEKIAINYFDKLNILITRPFNYTGLGQAEHFLVPKIVGSFKRGESNIALGNLDVFRDYSSVGFVVEAYVRLLLSVHKREIINICSGKAISLLQIIDLMQKISGYEISVTVNPKFVRENEVKFISGDNRKLFSLVGNIVPIEMETILTDMYKAP